MITGISDRSVFTEIRKNGRHVRSSDLRLRYLPGLPGEDSQIAYAISRKVGNAVTRNLIRRRLRSLFLEQLGSNDVASLQAAMVIVLPSAANCSYVELQTQVHELMKKVEKSTVSMKAGS